MPISAFRAPEEDPKYGEFFNAAAEGDTQRLEEAFVPSMNIDALEANILQGRGALHFAAQTGSVPTIQWLLAHGATVDLRNSEGDTPLHEAAFWARTDAIKALLQAGADINLPTGYYDLTALHHVLKYKHTVTPEQIETINFLLDQGLDVNREDDWYGATLIDQAVGLRSVELVEILIDRGARFDNTLPRAMHDPLMVKYLLSRGAKVVSPRGKESAITNGAGAADVEVIRLLISHADEAELAASHEALHWAAARGRIDIIQLLIDHKFDVNATIEDCYVGRTPLLAACESRGPIPQKIAVAQLLIKNGADVHAHNEAGTTAAEMILQDHSLRGDSELQQLLNQTNARCGDEIGRLEPTV